MVLGFEYSNASKRVEIKSGKRQMKRLNLKECCIVCICRKHTVHPRLETQSNFVSALKWRWRELEMAKLDCEVRDANKSFLHFQRDVTSQKISIFVSWLQ